MPTRPILESENGIKIRLPILVTETLGMRYFLNAGRCAILTGKTRKRPLVLTAPSGPGSPTLKNLIGSVSRTWRASSDKSLGAAQTVCPYYAVGNTDSLLTTPGNENLSHFSCI
jgi:hypothetical protein